MDFFPFVQQRDSMQCGVAALTMISRHFGCCCNCDDISKICFASNRGISLRGIAQAAQVIGFDTKSAYLTIEHLALIQLPCILFWNQNHFVVLYKISRNQKYFWIADPAKGKIKYTRDELIKHWIVVDGNFKGKGVAMIFEKNKKLSLDLKQKQGKKQAIKFLTNYFRSHLKHFGIIILGLILGCILQLLMPFLTQAIVDIGIKKKDIDFIWLILLGELMIVIGRTTTDIIRRWLLLHISMRINISLVSDFFIKLLKLPMQFFDTKNMGDLLQRIGDHTRIQNFLSGQLLNIVFSLLNFMIFGIVLFIYNKLIFAIFITGSLAYGGWILLFLNRRKILDYSIFEQEAINQNRTYQFITSMQEIKLQNCENRRRWEWEDTQADLFLVQMDALKLQQSQEAGSVFINEIKNILITVFAATAVIHGQMTIGAMLAIQYIVGQLNSPVEQLLQLIYSIQDVRISLERINEVHQGENEDNDSRNINTLTNKCSIELKNVIFKYNPHELKNTLDDVSFEIPHGKVTAIVGASGSGKTTLLKLMLGYYPVTGGEIYIGNENINSYNLKWWRNQCGVVMQEGVIFSESIERNIAIDDGPIDWTRLEFASKLSNIYDYIISLPLKYKTIIGRDGSGLSQGQKQRILIARAIYKNSKFIFFDEATNSLDAENEKAIVENLNKFYEGKTVVIVAHRLSTVKNADNIIVLDHGKVVESGNHSSLVALGGKYYNLIKNQLELG